LFIKIIVVTLRCEAKVLLYSGGLQN